jgi:mannose-1-phosphate guanylyltransferase/mannose-6-phosphate isomerase
LARFAAEGFGAPLVMTGDAFRFLALEQAAETGLSDARVVVEPVGRDTAPAILTAALMLEDTPDALMLVAPSDHVIPDAALPRGRAEGRRSGSNRRVRDVRRHARPSRDGVWLSRTGRHARRNGAAVPLKSFREKPDLETAQAMLARAATCGTRASS